MHDPGRISRMQVYGNGMSDTDGAAEGDAVTDTDLLSLHDKSILDDLISDKHRLAWWLRQNDEDSATYIEHILEGSQIN